MILTEVKNSYQDFLHTIRTDCSAFIEQDVPLFRSDVSKFDYGTRQIRKNRIPKDASSTITVFVNLVVELNTKMPAIRQQGLFATPRYDNAANYGPLNTIFFVFPKNGSTYFTSHQHDNFKGMKALQSRLRSAHDDFWHDTLLEIEALKEYSDDVITLSSLKSTSPKLHDQFVQFASNDLPRDKGLSSYFDSDIITKTPRQILKDEDYELTVIADDCHMINIRYALDVYNHHGSGYELYKKVLADIRN